MKEQFILFACFFGILALLAPAQGARVFGNLAIFGQTNSFPARTVITATNADTGALLSTLTVSSKSYNILVPNNTKVAFLFEPTQFVNVNGWTVQGLFPRKYVLDIGISDVSLDILDLQQCYHLVIEGYNAEGLLMNFDAFSTFRWMSDLTGETSRGYWSKVYRGSNVTDTTLSMTVPLSFEPSAINLQFPVPDFGNIVLHADNGGSGWSSNVAGGVVIQWNYEIARTLADTLATMAISPEYAETAKIDTIQFSLSFVSGLFASLESELEIGSISKTEAAARSDAVTVRALEAVESMELVRADMDIKKYRTSDIVVKVIDHNGNPIPNATVSLFQMDHDFKFGAYGGEFVAESPDWWVKLKGAGLNSANLAFWWAFVESVNNSFDDSFYFNQNAGFLQTNGFNLSSTGIFQLYPTLVPDYVKNMNNFTNLLLEIYAHVKDVCVRYLDDFEYLEFAADMHQKSNLMGLNREQANQMLRVSYQAIIDCKTAANKVSVHCNHDYFSQSKRESYILESWDTDSLSPIKFHETWVSAFKGYDAIIANGTGSFDTGITIAASQAFYSGGGFLGNAGYEPAFHMGVYSNLLDKLGNVTSVDELRVTEVGVPGVWLQEWDERDAGWWHTKWNEATQAEFIKQLYTIAFSKAKMREISWWGISDQYIYYPQGNWLKLDGTPKAAYFAVQSLIESWKTNEQVQMDKEGVNQVSCYGGSHTINLTINGVAAIPNGDVNVYLPEQTKYMTIFVQYFNDSNIFRVNATIVPPDVLPSPSPESNNNVVVVKKKDNDWWIVAWVAIALGGCCLLILLLILLTYTVKKYRKVSDEHSEIDSLPPQDDEPGRGRQKGGKLSDSDEDESVSEASSREEDRAALDDSDIDVQAADKNGAKNQALMAAVEQRSTEESSSGSDSDSMSSKTSESEENSENSEDQRGKGGSEESDSDSSSSGAGAGAKDSDSSEEEGLRKPEAKLKEEDSSDSDE